jgi:hypothetical protein
MDIASKNYLLPGEDPEIYQRFAAETLEEVTPRTPYQIRLAVSLAQIEWKLSRHRRLLTAAIWTGFREQAHATGKYKAPGHNSEHFRQCHDDLGLGRDLLSDDHEVRQEAEKRLASMNVTRSEITAAAYRFASDQVG